MTGVSLDSEVRSRCRRAGSSSGGDAPGGKDEERRINSDSDGNEKEVEDLDVRLADGSNGSDRQGGKSGSNRSNRSSRADRKKKKKKREKAARVSSRVWSRTRGTKREPTPPMRYSESRWQLEQ